jgi:hypothetical protein
MSTPLRTLVHELLYDDAARATFSADPAGYLGDHGWEDLEGADVSAALGALVHELPIEDAARLHPIANAAEFGDGGSGAVAGLQAAATAFDTVDVDAEAPDPATTLDDDTAGHGGEEADPDNSVEDVDADDPSLGIDEEPSEFRQEAAELSSATPAGQPVEDDDMGTVADAITPGTPWAFEHETDTTAPEAGWMEDHDALTAEADLFEDPMTAVDGHHHHDDAWSTHDGDHDVDDVQHHVGHDGPDPDEVDDA